MPDYIGNIAVPEITPSGVFPLVPDYPLEVRRDHEVVVHQFGSGNAKIEQRFLLGTGARRFTIRKQWLRDAERIALRNFWESKYGPYGAFTYNAANDDGIGTTPVVCRFANEPLSWEMVADWACSVGVTLVEIPQSTPSYTLTQTVNRFPPAALQSALLSQVQEIIPLVRIQPLQPGYPAIYVSDRRCTIGGQLYQARLLEFDGISQSIGNESDEARFTFGNADRVMRDLANDVDLFRAEIAFSLFHVGTGIKIDLWKGNIVNWSLDAGPEFDVTAADGLYELNLPYPTRKISRTCWKRFNDAQACPFAERGALDLVNFPNADPTRCDKGFDTPNGCRAHGMNDFYGGIIAKPQGVRIKDNSTGVWGFGRSTLTSVSLVADSIYDQVLPEIYTDSPMPVNAKIAMGRDESDFYAAVGIVGEGPLGAYGTGHKLDGQYHHGYPGALGLMTSLGPDPNPTTFGFDTDAGPERAAGTAFLMIRRSDAKGLQLSRLSEHSMEAVVARGLGGWVWTAPGARAWMPGLTNPIWIAVNMLLRAQGLRLGAGATTQQLDFAETLFDVQAAINAAAICDQQVTKLVGTGTETQFKFRGVLQEEKPLRDWLQEVLMNCLGYYTFANGKLKLGVRVNSSAVEAFTEGNILFRSLELAPLKPSFNHLTANFADEDFEFVANSISLYDIDHATLIGAGAGPLFLKSTVNLSGTASKSQAARIISVRLREELGGISPEEWKKARQISFKTTVLALNTEPGMVCSMTHPDMPGGSGEFRVTSWRLNKDFSIDIQGRTTTDSMYDLVAGPKPADVEASPVPIEPDNLVPGHVQPIGEEPFLLSKIEDGVTVTLAVEYDPPADMSVFAGVTAHVEAPDESRVIALANDYDYNGDATAEAGTAARHGTCELKLPQPSGGNETWRVYLTPRSRAYKVPLVFHGEPNESPSAAVEVSRATGVAAPPRVARVALAEKPASRRLAQNEDGAWVTLLTLQVTVELASDPLPNQWVAIKLSRDDKEHWDGWTHDREITSKTQTFDIDIYVPASGNTFWARAWSRIPGYPGSVAEAVQSDAGAYIAGLAEPSPNAVTNASLSIRWRKTDQEIYAWGPAVQWTNPTPEQEPNFWTTMLRVGWVNANGEPKTEYGDPEFGYSAEVTNDDHPGKVVLYDGGQFWLFPAEDDPFPIARFSIWVRNRAGAAIKQFCWPGGADHFDVLLSDPATAPQDVEDFTVGTKKPDGSYDPVPSWDLLNEKLVFDWGCFLPADVSNLGAVGLFFKRPGGEWTPTFHDVSWIKPQPGVPYEDSFAVAGQDVPRQPEPWTFVACVADRRGAWKLNQDGTPAGPQITINTIGPNKGIEAGNINPAALDTPLAILNEKIAIVDKGIAERYLADQAVTARTMAEKAITAQNKALDALSVLNSNIDSVHIGKIINGTVIFNGDVFMARGYGYPLVQMSWNGIILWSGAETYGDSKAGTAQAVGLTSRPHVLIASNAIQLFSAASGPSATITSLAVTFWSDHNNTAQPYAQLSSAGLVVTSGAFVSTFSASQIQLRYGTGVSMTLSAAQLKLLNGTYSFEMKPTGWTLWAVDQNENYPFIRATVDGMEISGAKFGLVLENTETRIEDLRGPSGNASILVRDLEGEAHITTLIYPHSVEIYTYDFTYGVRLGAMRLPQYFGNWGYLEVYRDGQRVITLSGMTGEAFASRFWARTAAWSDVPLQLGDYYLWVDSSGRLRIKNGAPTFDTDGTVVGAQS